MVCDLDQWHPRLYRGITPLDGNVLPEGETLDHVLADDAVRWLRNQNAAAPDKPYLLYLAPGTTHAPHQVPAEWINRFRGASSEEHTSELQSLMRMSYAGFCLKKISNSVTLQ